MKRSLADLQKQDKMLLDSIADAFERIEKSPTHNLRVAASKEYQALIAQSRRIQLKINELKR